MDGWPDDGGLGADPGEVGPSAIGPERPRTGPSDDYRARLARYLDATALSGPGGLGAAGTGPMATSEPAGATTRLRVTVTGSAADVATAVRVLRALPGATVERVERSLPMPFLGLGWTEDESL